jgi:hypothetical protein
MNVETNFGASEMRAVAKAGERGGINIAATRTEQRGYLFPTPTTEPSWMNQHEGPWHGSAPSVIRKWLTRGNRSDLRRVVQHDIHSRTVLGGAPSSSALNWSASCKGA